jgi:hypothetical protein
MDGVVGCMRKKEVSFVPLVALKDVRRAGVVTNVAVCIVRAVIRERLT